MSTLPPIPVFNEIIEVEIKGADVSTVFLVNDLMQRHNFPPLPAWWDYRWTVDKDPKHGYTGNFTKRIKKWLMVEHGIKAVDTVLSDLGECINRYLPKEESALVDFTPVFDWQPGTFGDSGSCWWSDRDDARQVLMENGGFAMRRWTEKRKPWGRCWVAVRPDHYILFNAYYNSDSLGIEGFARAMATLLNLSYRHGVVVKNLRRATGLVYANGQSGSVVGPAEVVRGMAETDMQLDVSEYAPMCNFCGTDLWGLGERETIGGAYYRCSDCRRAGKTTRTYEGRQVFVAA